MQNLKDKLSHLTFRQACKLLGPHGQDFIQMGGKYEIDFSNVLLRKDLFQLTLDKAVVTITLSSGKVQRLDLKCSICSSVCEHIGAAVSIILEEKLILGFAAPPPERVPIESLSDEELVGQAIGERAERAKKEKMRVNSLNTQELWSDYIVTNASS